MSTHIRLFLGLLLLGCCTGLKADAATTWQTSAQAPQDTVTDGSYQLYPLGIACRNGDLSTVKRLLETDEEPMAMGTEYAEFDILYTAIYYGKEEILRYALTKYSDLNNRLYSDESGLTLLTLACRLSHPGMARMLLECGIHVDGVQNPEDIYLVYPLLEAIQNKHIPLVKLLLSYHADTEVKDSNGNTPLSLARELGLTEVVELLETHTPEN